MNMQKFHIRDLPSRSVTLYPASAQVLRDIHDVALKSGSNQVEIYGLTPTADESSIKVDGKGSATITDMTVELVPNTDVFEHEYSSDSDYTSEESDEDASDLGEEEERPALQSVKDTLASLHQRLEDQNELQASANSRKDHLESFMYRIQDPTVEDISSNLERYRIERETVHNEWAASNSEIQVITKKIVDLDKEQWRLEKASMKEKEKIERENTKAKKKALERKQRAKAEKRLAKQRLNIERLSFWPMKVYRVVLSLDTNSSELTPSSSRRGSVESLVERAIPLQGITPQSENISCRITLVLSYITHSASWIPRYDLNFATPSSSGRIVYRAEFLNTTSETWRDAKVILSTSQTSFQGLNESIPNMSPWHLRLQKGQKEFSTPIIYSREEENAKVARMKNTQKSQEQKRSGLFGFDKGPNNWPTGMKQHQLQQQGLQQYQQQLQNLEQQDKNILLEQKKQMLLRKQHPNMAQMKPSSFGSNSSSFSKPPTNAGFGMGTTNLFGGNSALLSSGNNHQFGAPSSSMSASLPTDLEGEDDYSDEDLKTEMLCQTVGAPNPSLAFQESTWEETGLTATYDIPGIRTIPPSKTARRHKIAIIELKDVRFSYKCVPKLRTAAFLKASVTNNSGITLLRGMAGLTLDGSFLGNTNLPRCSIGETFTLPLGVDPAVGVLYGRPDVKKNLSSGVFQKEDSCMYTRTITLTNTRTTGGSIELLVLDQIPVSEDEKLRVEVLLPKGLKEAGDQAKAGQTVEPNGGDSTAKSGNRGSVYSMDGARGVVGKDEKWGKAMAKLRKAGTVDWEVKLNAGKTVKLILEYEMRFPANETVVGA